MTYNAGVTIYVNLNDKEFFINNFVKNIEKYDK